jgi:hypothetical protein
MIAKTLESRMFHYLHPTTFKEVFMLKVHFFFERTKWQALKTFQPDDAQVGRKIPD